MSKNNKLTIKTRQESDKTLLIDQLRKTPIVSIACEKTGIGRTSYYRWRDEDKDFATLADKSLAEGILLMNDMAESQLLTAIKEGNITSVFYWLNHRHKAYSNKLEINGSIETKNRELSEEQMGQIKKALHLFNKDDQ